MPSSLVLTIQTLMRWVIFLLEHDYSESLDASKSVY